jgi:tetratricopeptide (TPR) repeat protein
MELVALDPGRKAWRRNLAMLQRVMSSVLERKGNVEDALRLTHAALDAVEKLALADPASRTFQRDTSVLHTRISELLWKEGRHATAIEHLHRSLAVLDAGSKTAGQEWQWGLVATRTQLADRLFAQKQIQIAEEQLGLAKSLAERLHDSDPSNTAGAVALYTIHARIGRIAHAQGRSEQALGALQRCHDLVADLVKRDPQNHGWRLDLALTYHGIGELLEPVRGRRAEALANHVKAAGMLEALSRLNTPNPILQRTLADAHRRIVTLLAETGDRNGEARALRAGLATLQRLTKATPGDLVLAQTLAWFEQRHRQLSGGSR